MKKLQTTMFWALIASETSHVFCCVLPTMFSVLSLFVGVGLVTAVPMWMQSLHEVLHKWEIPMIMMSGLIVVLSWGLFFYSRGIDCHDTGCKHGNCTRQKKNAGLVLKIATALFVVNVGVYLVFHRGMGIFMPDVH